MGQLEGALFSLTRERYSALTQQAIATVMFK
jgi:hypothetical protein